MKFTIQQKDFLNKTQQALRFISPKPQLPILSCFLLSTTKNGVTLSATDLQEGIRLRMPAQVVDEDACVVPAKVLVEFLSTLEDQEIQCSVKEKTFFMKTKRNSIKLQTMSVADYPPFPEKEGEKIELPIQLLKESSEKVSFSSSRDETRPILTSLLFSLDSNSTVVATDGFRLATLTQDFQSKSPQTLLFPAKVLQEVTRILSDSELQKVDLYVSEKLKQGFFVNGSTEIMIRLLDGEFPKYQQIFPQSFSIEVKVDKDQLENVVKSALIFAKESSGIIQFQIHDTVFKVSASSSSVGEFQSELEITSLFQGEGKIAFNGKYVLEFLQKVDSNEVWFKMNDEMKPGLFVPEEEPGYQYLVMPFKLN